jgi:hypothetical protein
VLYLKFDESSSGAMIQKINFKNLNKKIFIQTKAKEATKNLVKLRSTWKRTWKMELNIEYQLLQQATQAAHKQTHTHTHQLL